MALGTLSPAHLPLLPSTLSAEAPFQGEQRMGVQQGEWL